VNLLNVPLISSEDQASRCLPNVGSFSLTAAFPRTLQLKLSTLDLIQDEILKSHTVDLKTCDLREFGMAIFDHTLVLKEASQPAKFAAMAAPAKSKPATKPQAEDDDWEQRLLDLTTKCEPIIGRVREGISKGWDWRFFSNNRSWKQAVKLAGKSFSNDAATLIQSLLKGGQ
jgi:hypothetical protein